jgi:hypothetical protein
MRILKKHAISLFFVLVLAPSAEAGVFNLPRFVEPGKNAVGVEPEVTLTNGGGVAANVRYTQGITELNNLTAILGTGTGRRRFRIGGAMTFDFFPDIDSQPGIGIATQAIYYRYEHARGQLEVAGIPYVHKRFHNGAGSTIEPFFALPTGPAFHSGEYHWQTQVVLGAIFNQTGSDLHFVGEVGVNVNKTESYVSGGLIFQPSN